MEQAFISIDPSTEEEIRRFEFHSETQIDSLLQESSDEARAWRRSSLEERRQFLHLLAESVKSRQEECAQLMTEEMGKPISQARAEAAKCASICEYYSDSLETLLAPKPYPTKEQGAYVVANPIGVVLAVMPWNFPFWQAFRCAVPAICAGNTIILKHSPNVGGCAQLIEEVFQSALPKKAVFSNLFCSADTVHGLIADRRVAGVSLTGSTRAGRAVAASAGEHLKKCVLELGGSDAYLILSDANIEQAINTCSQSRIINSGQSCISAKRILVDEAIYKDFRDGFLETFGNIQASNPKEDSCELGPLARGDLRENLQRQISASINGGSRLLSGGETPEGKGYFYPATVLESLNSTVPARSEELFGPATSLTPFKRLDEAIAIANETDYGLGACVITEDAAEGERIARDELIAGVATRNCMVYSDPRIPFGGTKSSGLGREMSDLGFYEFTNLKTVMLAE